MTETFAVLAMPTMEEVVRLASTGDSVHVRVEWPLDKFPGRDKERELHLAVTELNVRWQPGRRGFHEELVGSFVGITAGGPVEIFTITVKPAPHSRSEFVNTYTYSYNKSWPPMYRRGYA